MRNPYSGEVVALAASASSQDCNDAVEAAVRAFRLWEHAPLAMKRDYFLKAADLLNTEKYRAKVKAAIQDEICAVDYLVGMNLEVSTTMLREVAGMVTQLRRETFPSVAGGQVIAQRRAQGVMCVH